MIAYLYKAVISEDNQELRHNVEKIKLTDYKKVNNTRNSTELTLSSFKSKKFTALYRFNVTITNRNALQIETDDKIEIEGKKSKVSFVEVAPNQTGQFNKVLYVGLV